MATGNEYNTLRDLLKAIADAIRSKVGDVGLISAQDFPTNINAIVKATGNAQPSDVLSGKTFTNDSGEQIGTVPVRENGTNTVGSGKDNSGIWFYFPYGYYPEYSDGKAWITSDPSQYGNASPSDVLSGKTFTSSSGLNVTGTMTNRGAWGTTINPGGSVTIPAGYHNGGGKVSAGTSNPTGVAENGGTGSSKTAAVNSKVLCVSGGYSAWDYPNLSLQIKVNGSWIECTSSNGTLAQEGGYGASNGRRHKAKLWYNNGPYRNSIIQEIYAGGTDNDGAVTVLAIKG